MDSSACNALLDGLCGIGSNLRRIALDFADGACDFVHVFLVSKQGKLRKPHSFPGSTQSVRKLLLEEVVWLHRLSAAQALSILAAAKTIYCVQRRIACLRWNSLGIQRGNEVSRGDACEVLGIHVEDVGVLSIERAARIANLGRDARNLGKKRV